MRARFNHASPVQDDDLLLLLNAHHDEVPFTLPGEAEVRWNALADTSAADGTPVQEFSDAGTAYPLQGRSVALLRFRRGR